MVGPARSAMMIGGEGALQVRAKQRPLGWGDEDLIWGWDRKDRWASLVSVDRYHGAAGGPSSGVPSTLSVCSRRPHGRR